MKKIFLLCCMLVMSAWAVNAVTFNVRVPANTKKCYVCGDFNGWDAGAAMEMTAVDSNLFTLTLSNVSSSDVAKGYKYLCGQDWSYVEKDASGGEISNRTQIGDPDVVGSWYNVPEWDIVSAEIQVNGYSRLLKVYLPENYEATTESYPVIYYNTVQQRYNDAGNDADAGDYFFGSNSWNAHASMESLRAQGGKAYVMVQICSFLAENTPEEHPEFIGTGGASRYLAAFVNELIPYVESKWRVSREASGRIIVGADYGALFSLYAVAERPDIFGTSVAISPMLWINKEYFESLASKNSAFSPKFYIAAGSREPDWMKADASALAAALAADVEGKVSFTLYDGATHDDVAWGKIFPDLLKAVSSGSVPSGSVILNSSIRKVDSTPFESRVYTLYAGADKNNLQKIGPFVFTDDYRKKGTVAPVKAFVNTNEVGLSFKSTYYWNVACGEDSSAGWLLPEVKDIGFSSKKSEVSWQNVAIFEDGTTADIAAHSKAFKVVTASGETIMTKGEGFLSYATVSFPGKDKSFRINFGSVNSASDMGAVTPDISVGEKCVEAYIVYDFNLNKVTVNETKQGENIENLTVHSFIATPAVAMAGTDVRLDIGLSGSGDIEVTCKKNSNQNVAVTAVRDSDSTFHINFMNPQEGLYTFNVTLVVGNTRQTNAAEINLRVLPSGATASQTLTVNPYKDVDWENVGRYKANFHTHTSQSFDTQYTTTQVVDKYQAAGYKILSLTDHDANSYPWSMFSLYNSLAADRLPEEMGILAVPGVELSKDRRNNWSEKTGGEFNHHNDFFTGRKGQEFMSLRESYAYTQALGGMQIINHPGQYWNLSTEYKNGEKNSPEWHAENFKLYSSLVGLEVYNQGNRRPNDRILWDQILSLTMPSRPVWGYSCDDTHTAEQYFRNYQFMLMPELSTDALKDAMAAGTTVFSYEYTGSGQALAPHVNAITVDEERNTITVSTDDADSIEWIYSTHRTSSGASSTKSTVIGFGPTFNYSGYQGSYVRARLVNKYGETAIQPFGFDKDDVSGGDTVTDLEKVFDAGYNPSVCSLSLICTEGIERVSVVNVAGMVVKYVDGNGQCTLTLDLSELSGGVYVAVAASPRAAYTYKFIK